MSLPLIEAEAYVDEGIKTDNPTTKQKGMDLFSSMAAKPNPWPVLVAGILDKKFPDAANGANAQPLAMWMRANELMEAGHNADGSSSASTISSERRRS